MPKTFYSLEEAAAKLGMSPEQVKDLAQQNKLQQYRNGDRIMFKVEQVDALAGGGKDDSAGPIALADSGSTDAIKLSDESAAGKSDAIDLAAATDITDSPASPGKTGAGKTGEGKKDDARQATGVSVFDADEVEHADPKAQTQVTNPSSTADEELALESVGSGSGLLDLTRESDDTSLGAELLDEIYPGSEGAGAKADADAGGTAGATAVTAGGPPGSSGVFDGAIQMESGPSGLENISQGSEVMPMMSVPVVEETSDPLWSGITLGAFIGTTVTLVVGLMVVTAGIMGIKGPIVQTFATPGSLLGFCAVLLVVSIIFAAIGAAVMPKITPR